MYPFLKLSGVLLKVKFRAPLNIRDKSVPRFRVGLTDADLFGELNNARYPTFPSWNSADGTIAIGSVSSGS
jgi:hypothetical protein